MPGATSYLVQISTSPAFSTIVVEQRGITNTSYSAGGLANSTVYYWRASASDLAGAGPYSATWSFTTVDAPTGLAAPTLVSPADGLTGVSTSPTLRWDSVPGASWYQVQVSTSPAFSTIIVDQGGIAGTSYNVSSLAGGTVYYWRVSASHSGGSGPYSSTGRFTTTLASAVEIMVDESPRELQLSQNYPNPFNPTTTISYGLPKAMTVSVKVFDVSGQLVSVLIDGYRQQGYYRVHWKAEVPSGIYFYRLQAGSYVATKKMILVR
ncbi:MAG: Por secretion system C-terminal sorting protein [Bacteroidetes bacterium]|nr:Por secretion system C-terminal sorting protein [Bacteroidota bacterium]